MVDEIGWFQLRLKLDTPKIIAGERAVIMPSAYRLARR
jgi:hypothetical protein